MKEIPVSSVDSQNKHTFCLPLRKCMHARMVLRDAKCTTDVGSVKEVLERLTEIDDLLGNDGGEDQSMLLNYLRADGDLLTTAALQESKLHAQCDDFVRAHVANANNIARLYREFGQCEQKLIEFETGIVEFQRRLASSADGIVLMQQQTEQLQRSVRHRKQVSHTITEVYSALQECDIYCARIAHDDVDDDYFSTLRQVAHKLSFLSHNTELHHSAVDNEIRPKLSAAAASAGKRLLLFYSHAIEQLVAYGSARDMTALAERQEYLEQVTQMGYRFLLLYNAPVAQTIRQRYAQSMQVAYSRLFRDELRVFEQQSSSSRADSAHMRHGYPILTVTEISAILTNADEGSPVGSTVEVPASVVFAYRTGHASHALDKTNTRGQADRTGRQVAHTLPRDTDSGSNGDSTANSSSCSIVGTSRRHSISSRDGVCNAKGAEDATGGFIDDASARRSATTSLADAHNITRALRIRHGKLELDSQHDRPRSNSAAEGGRQVNVLAAGTSNASVRAQASSLSRVGWVWLFAQLLLFLVNTCVAECHFIGSFFGDAEGGENYEEAERLARVVLDSGGILTAVQHGLSRDVAHVHDRWALLAALRVVETTKNYLCTSLDPIPLLLLSGVLETAKSSLTNAMRSVVCQDLRALDFVAHTPLTPFHTKRRSSSSRESSVRLELSPDVSFSNHATSREGLAQTLHRVAPIHTLWPHRLVIRVVAQLSHLHRLNTMALHGSGGLGVASATEGLGGTPVTATDPPYSDNSAPVLEFCPSDTRGCDAGVMNMVRSGMLTDLPSVIHRLSHRHDKGLPRATFTLVNVYALWAIWKEMMTTEDLMSCAPVNVMYESDTMRIDRSSSSSSSDDLDDTDDDDGEEDCSSACDEPMGCSAGPTRTTPDDPFVQSLTAYKPLRFASPTTSMRLSAAHMSPTVASAVPTAATPITPSFLSAIVHKLNSHINKALHRWVAEYATMWQSTSASYMFVTSEMIATSRSRLQPQSPTLVTCPSSNWCDLARRFRQGWRTALQTELLALQYLARAVIPHALDTSVYPEDHTHTTPAAVIPVGPANPFHEAMAEPRSGQGTSSAHEEHTRARRECTPPCALDRTEMCDAAAVQRARRWRTGLCDALCRVYVMELVRCNADFGKRCDATQCEAAGKEVSDQPGGQLASATGEHILLVGGGRIVREARRVLKRTRDERSESVIFARTDEPRHERY